MMQNATIITKCFPTKVRRCMTLVKHIHYWCWRFLTYLTKGKKTAFFLSLVRMHLFKTTTKHQLLFLIEIPFIEIRFIEFPFIEFLLPHAPTVQLRTGKPSGLQPQPSAWRGSTAICTPSIYQRVFWPNSSLLPERMPYCPLNQIYFPCFSEISQQAGDIRMIRDKPSRITCQPQKLSHLLFGHSSLAGQNRCRFIHLRTHLPMSWVEAQIPYFHPSNTVPLVRCEPRLSQQTRDSTQLLPVSNIQ